jgi:hypothetical protein
VLPQDGDGTINLEEFSLYIFQQIGENSKVNESPMWGASLGTSSGTCLSAMMLGECFVVVTVLGASCAGQKDSKKAKEIRKAETVKKFGRSPSAPSEFERVRSTDSTSSAGKT